MKNQNTLTIFSRIRKRLHATARNIAGEDNADDVLQDAFCKLWTLKHIPSSQQQAERMTFTIVKNISIDYRRHADRNDLTSTVGRDETDDSQMQYVREIFETVKSIIDNQLSDIQRKVLWMRDYEGYSFTEIAQQMNMTEASVRQTLSRGRKVIRETYKKIN